MSPPLVPALLLALLIWRFWLAATLPITGDEGYFIGWGQRPDWGYYDHPPMVGWWLAAQLPLGDGPLWLRITSVLLPFGVALMMLIAARVVERDAMVGTGRSASAAAAIHVTAADIPVSADTYRRAALLVPLLPINVWNVLITTDTPLIAFCALSGLAWLRVRAGGGSLALALAALGLAGAVLSKYFAALLWLAFLVDTLTARGPRPWRALIVVTLACLPPVLLMAWWNSRHCWTNVMFNFINRNVDMTPGGVHFASYVGMLLYSLTPLALVPLLRRGGRWALQPTTRSLLCLAVVPLVAFGVLSVMRSVGLHWMLAFLPFALLALLQAGSLWRRTLTCFLAGLAAAHMVVFSLVLLMPMSGWQGLAQFPQLALYLDTPPLAQALERRAAGATLATMSYAQSAVLAYHLRRPVITLGEGTYHGRQPDLDTDLRSFDGQPLMILGKPDHPEELAPLDRFFQSTRLEELTHHGVHYPVLRGDGFHFERYRQDILSNVLARFYQFPEALRHGSCPVTERYAQ